MDPLVSDASIEAFTTVPVDRVASPLERRMTQGIPLVMPEQNGGMPGMNGQEINEFLRGAIFEKAIPASDPIKVMRDSLLLVYETLGNTIEKATRPPAGFGFKVDLPEPVLLDDLNAACTRFVRRVAPIITSPALNEQMVSMQTMAKDLNAAFLSFRLFLSRREFQGGIPEPALPEVAQELIGFQRMIAEPMNFLMSLSHGVVVQPQVAETES